MSSDFFSLSLELDFSFSFPSCWCYWLVLIGLTRSDQIGAQSNQVGKHYNATSTMADIRMHSCDQQLNKADQHSYCEATRADQSNVWPLTKTSVVARLAHSKTGCYLARPVDHSSRPGLYAYESFFYDMLFFSFNLDRMRFRYAQFYIHVKAYIEYQFLYVIF